MNDQQNTVKPSNPAPSLPTEANKAQVSNDGHIIKPQSSSLQDLQNESHDESGGECRSMKTHECFDKEAASQGNSVDDDDDDDGEETGGWEAAQKEEEEHGGERVERQRIEVARGRVGIPDIWGQEELLKDWIDCSAFDACLVPKGIISARASLVDETRRANSTGLSIENSC